VTAPRWDRVKELLHQAAELGPEPRAKFLDEACAADAPLRAELESLLSVDAGLSDDFLRSPLSGDPQSHREEFAAASLSAGQIFAQRFLLIRKLGEGGMGQVWLAEQTAPVRRPVALKLIRAGMYDEAVVQRFQAERQSLAIMEHPCIAKVFDAGSTPQGQPYFVMEYVPGLPITEYCDQKRLTIRERSGAVHPGLRRRAARAPEGDHSPRFEAGQHIDRRGRRRRGAADHRFRLAKATTPDMTGQTLCSPASGSSWARRAI
jgi:hypothetical protein